MQRMGLEQKQPRDREGIHHPDGCEANAYGAGVSSRATRVPGGRRGPIRRSFEGRSTVPEPDQSFGGLQGLGQECDD